MAHIVPKPTHATCAACMKRKQCITKRILATGELRQYDQFAYSPDHRGWLCKKCHRKFMTEGPKDVPDILRKP